jgi:carbon monoxide dehydrogenase subunit G
MKFENTFAIEAPISQVWDALMDVQRVAPCMPGAQVLERGDGDAYKVGVRVKVGPISMQYRGQVEISERDDAAHTATMRARARETRGQGTANAVIHMSLVERADATQATIETELQLSGRAASMGRGVLVDVSQQLIGEFATNLAAMLGSDGMAPAEGADAQGQPAEAPAATPGPPAPSPAATPGPPAPSPAATPGPPAPSPAATPGPPAPSPAATPGPPAPSPAATPGPPAPSPAEPAASALPAGRIAAKVIANRLGEPRTLLSFVAVLLAIGYALGRSR